MGKLGLLVVLLLLSAAAFPGRCQRVDDRQGGAVSRASAPQAEALQQSEAALRTYILPSPPSVPPPGAQAVAGQDLPRIIASRIASGDTKGAGALLHRTFQGEWGAQATAATLLQLNELVKRIGCDPAVRDTFADAYRRAKERSTQTAISSALRGTQGDIGPLAVCLIDAIAAGGL